MLVPQPKSWGPVSPGLDGCCAYGHSLFLLPYIDFSLVVFQVFALHDRPTNTQTHANRHMNRRGRTQYLLHAAHIAGVQILIHVDVTSSSTIAERPRCRVGQFWPKVEDDILQTL